MSDEKSPLLELAFAADKQYEDEDYWDMDDLEAPGWKLVGSQAQGEGRWAETVWTIYEHSTAGFAAVEWERGLTEMQEDDFFGSVFAVEGYVVTETRYREVTT